MRTWIAMGLGLLVASAFAGPAAAQAPFAQNDEPNSSLRYDGRFEADRAERQRLAKARRLIYQRAVEKARQRAARIEARKWAGVSPARPTIQAGVFGTRLNPDPWAHWTGFHFRLVPCAH